MERLKHGEVDLDDSTGLDRNAILGCGQELVMPDGGFGFLIQSKSEATPGVNFFGRTIHPDQNLDKSDLHIGVFGEWIGEVRVDHVDGKGRRVGKRLVMLVFQFGWVWWWQVSLCYEDLGNSLGAIGIEDNTYVNPHRDGLARQPARLKPRHFHSSEGGSIKFIAMLVQELNVLRQAFLVDDHGHHGHALKVFGGHTVGVGHRDSTYHFWRGDFRAGVIDPILVWHLMNHWNRGNRILCAKA